VHRRRYLALAAVSVAGLAGCTGLPGGGSGDGTPTAGPDIVTKATLQPALVGLWVDYLRPTGVDEQHLFLALDAGDEGPAREALSLEFGGASHDPVPATELRNLYRTREGDSHYSADSGTGLLVFSLPESADARPASTRLSWPGGLWRPDAALTERLQAPPPSLSVAFDGPAEVSADETVTVTATVTNEGDVDGRFVAGLNRYGPVVASYPVAKLSAAVPAGQSTAVEHATAMSLIGEMDQADVGDGEVDGHFGLQYPGGDAEAAFAVVD